MTSLSLRNVCFGYGGGDVLADVSLDFPAGRAVALLGASGSGKTTLLWLLAGLLRPRSGSVALLRDGEDRPRPVGEARFGMVFQQHALWDHLTARAHLTLVLTTRRGLDRRARRRRAEELLDRVGLLGLAARRPGEMSGGQQRRLALARALAAEPDWLLLDEPLSHLDGPVRAELLTLLRELLAACGAGAVLATHEPAEAFALAGTVAVLSAGRLRQVGPGRDVYAKPVDLEVARMLGPAGELSGVAADGCLFVEGQAVLVGLPADARGPRKLILRPHELAFVAAEDGLAVVRRWDFLPPCYMLTVSIAGQDIQVLCGRPHAPGRRGELRMSSREV